MLLGPAAVSCCVLGPGPAAGSWVQALMLLPLPLYMQLGRRTRSNMSNVVSPLSINTNDESLLSSPNTSNETAPSASEAAASLSEASEGVSAPDSDELSPRTPMPPQPMPQPLPMAMAVPGSPELQLQAQLQRLEADAVLDEQLDNQEAAVPESVTAVVSVWC